MHSFSALNRTNLTHMQISELKAKQQQQGAIALLPEQLKLLEGEDALKRHHDDLKKMYPRVAKKLLETASGSVDHPKTHEYFYVLPNCRDDYWHDVFQQRLDSDDRSFP